MPKTSDEALKAEIARLTGVINRHKASESWPAKPASTSGRNHSYVNPRYKPYAKPASRTTDTEQPVASSTSTLAVGPTKPREVVIDGVAFQSSRRSLVRKDLAKSAPTAKISSRSTQPQGTHSIQRPYKPRSRRHFTRNRNMTLASGKGSVRMNRKSMKYIDKQCSRFSVTGVCSRGRTCSYKHDPSRVAICWPFLQGNCPNTEETCSLSHDPAPERTPLCVHFANNGRCKNGQNCLFPHVHVGLRNGVCRDFAVLGYCEKGLDCDYQHIRECPDFADKGSCPNHKCKLPHVIRANRRRNEASKSLTEHSSVKIAQQTSLEQIDIDHSLSAETTISAADANIGDEYISLTFHESGESEDDTTEEDDAEEDSVSEDEDN